ncbi:RNA binding motif protein, X-linked-like-1 isoform X3 [Brassica rapa]|uniref:RNA binding motif protein, X-linked-like-1 isoform X3 n=1 Tax=Brassica campestris TaxID=3711 RepID=UPI00142DFACA|nr:RNA binding motif protein, X-linked-like-1 isoform X3 [Brassica rapa]
MISKLRRIQTTSFRLKVKTIFIDGLSTSWSEEHVRDLLKRYGKLEKIELARNMPSARRKDFGFVTFDTHEAAVTCAKSINNSELGEGEDKAKVRARLSRPLHGAGKGRQPSRSDHRSSRHGSRRSGRSSLARLPPRSSRGVGPRAPPPSSAKRVSGSRGRRPRPPLPPPARARPSRPLPPPARSRPLPPPARSRPLPPPARSYDRRPPVPPYPKASLKRDYGRRDDLLPPRSRPALSYSSSRLSPERHLSYRDDYAPRGSAYSDIPRDSSRLEMRRPYGEDLYSPRFERPPPSYSEGRSRAYDEPLPGSKRPYSALDDVPPRYADVDARHSRARLDYDLGPSQYGESYGDRIPRSSLGYGSSRNAMTSHDSRGPYSSSRQGMDYGGGSYSSSDVVGMYSSSYGSEPPRRDVSSSYGSDIPPRRDGGGSSYSSVYSSRGLGGSSYSGGGGGPGSYY